MWKYSILTAMLVALGATAGAEDASTSPDLAADINALTTASEFDGDAAASIFQKSCRACHGNNAQGASSYPGLADLEPDYIATQLVRYRSGEKIGPNSILMISSAKALSDDDIVNISVYVATAFD